MTGVQTCALPIFGFREPDGGGFTLPGIRCERADLRSHLTQLPLGLMVEFTGTGALIEAEHLVEVLAPALVAQLLDHFVVLLESALAQPDTPLCRLDLIDPDGLRWLHEVSVGERFDAPPATLADLIEAQVARTPDAIAVVYEGRRYTYGEINAAANRVAHWLIAAGIGAEDRVAVLLDKSVDLIVTALGVVKAGGVYLPIDPTYPADRLDFILTDCDAEIVVREPITDLSAQRDDNPTDADRLRPLDINGRAVHQIGLPYHWGQGGDAVVTGDAANDLIGVTMDPNVFIQESKVGSCAMIAGRRPRGGAALDLVREYQRRAGVTMETDNERVTATDDADGPRVQEGDRQWDS
mgnify:CR=1 FL=1